MTPPTSSPRNSLRKSLDTPAAAEYLGLHPRTLDNWRSQRRGPCFVRVGRLIRYRVEDLEEYLASRKVETDNR